MVTLDKIYHASHVLKEIIRPTELIKAPKICPDCNLYIKTENLQVPLRSEALIIKSLSSQMRKRRKA